MSNKEKVTAIVVDGGGRGQAFAYGLAKSSYVSRIIVVPGNGGTESLSQQFHKPIENYPLSSKPERKLVGTIVDLAQATNNPLVIVGPETWLEAGLGDALAEKKINAIAPPVDRAILETDKATARVLCQRWEIPQPDFKVFTDPTTAFAYVKQSNLQEGVVKVAGLASGKGVAVCDSQEELLKAIDRAHEKFGKAADKIVLEQRLRGVEASFIVLSDGKNIAPLVSAMDHKRLNDGDIGPNTGGMGVIAPNPIVTPDIAQKITDKIIMPTVKGMWERGTPYVGFLYAGVMITDSGDPYLIEFNARGGDPETQAQIPLLSTDFYQLLRGCIDKSLGQLKIRYENKHSAVVVLTAEEYPEKITKSNGTTIHGLNTIRDERIVVFHAGTVIKGGIVKVNGGRVLGVTAIGDTLEEAVGTAYSVIGSRIHFDGMKYRTDIGKKVIGRILKKNTKGRGKNYRKKVRDCRFLRMR